MALLPRSTEIQPYVAPIRETLCDRVSALESRFDRLVNARANEGNRKYTWTAEIEGGPVDRKYKWTAEIKEGNKKGKEEKKKIDKNYKWTAKIKGKGEDGPTLRTYTFEASTGDAGDCSKSDKKEKKEKKKDTKKGEIGRAHV